MLMIPMIKKWGWWSWRCLVEFKLDDDKNDDDDGNMHDYKFVDTNYGNVEYWYSWLW